MQGLLDQHVNSLEQSQTQEEQVRHQWNQQLADKEAQIRELQDKLDSVLQPRMSSARSRDELETISDNEGGLVAITKQLKHVLQTLKVVCTIFLLACHLAWQALDLLWNLLKKVFSPKI